MNLIAIRSALDVLPATCPHHGNQIEPAPRLLRREACCESGVPAMRRRRAEAELDRLHTEQGRTRPPAENCYCGGPEEIYPHRVGTGYYCRPEPGTRPDTTGETETTL